MRFRRGADCDFFCLASFLAAKMPCQNCNIAKYTIPFWLIKSWAGMWIAKPCDPTLLKKEKAFRLQCLSAQALAKLKNTPIFRRLSRLCGPKSVEKPMF